MGNSNTIDDHIWLPGYKNKLKESIMIDQNLNEGEGDIAMNRFKFYGN